MINRLYTSKNGTPHVVRALETVREFTKGEKMENTATTEQVLLQRQKQESIARWTFYVDDLSYPKFTMQLETFLEEYKEIDSPKQETFGEMLQNRFGDETPIIFINEGCKEYSSMKTGIKMRVTPEQSVKVQEIVFKNGRGWNTTGRRYTSFIDAPFLYLSEKRQLMLGTEEASFYEEPEIEVDADLFIRTRGTCEENKLCGSEELKTIKDALEEIQEANRQAEKPIQYQIGIDTFQRSKANHTAAETRVEIAKFMIDKYNWRNKGQDIEDFKKIKDYCDFAIEALNEIKG